MKKRLKRLISGIIWVYSMSMFMSVLYAQEINQYNQTEQLEGHTKQEIYLKYQKLKPVSKWEQIYETSPLLTAPYDEGSLTEAFLQDGLNGVNWMRYLAGLPDDIQLDYSLAERQQIGSLINYVGEFSHYPSKPEGMSEVMYQQGKKATSTSNLASGYSSIYESIKGYMEDSDSSNIDRVGHRRWLLNPQMQKTMFGYVGKESWGNYNGASSMYALDESRTEEVAYNAISWPSAGYFPKEYFEDKTAWSISLNPQVYARDRVDEITVKLTREETGEEWLFTQDDKDTFGKYFNVETGGYGVSFCIIFRPDLKNYFIDNVEETYTVSVMGLYKEDGTPSSLTFSTTFFELNNYNPSLEAFVTRLYENCLDREADAEGLAYWMQRLREGETAAHLSAYFIESEELVNKQLSDSDYLRIMYSCFFDRIPDVDGETYWLGELESGLSRKYVLAQFVNSLEFEEICSTYDVNRGEIVLTEIMDQHPQLVRFVSRFYTECLGRRGSAKELEFWVLNLSHKSMTAKDLAQAFVLSPEFESKNLSDEAYTEVMYRIFLNRNSDLEGITYWCNRLKAGENRSDMLMIFIQVDEFAEICREYGL